MMWGDIHTIWPQENMDEDYEWKTKNHYRP